MGDVRRGPSSRCKWYSSCEKRPLLEKIRKWITDIWGPDCVCELQSVHQAGHGAVMENLALLWPRDSRLYCLTQVSHSKTNNASKTADPQMFMDKI